MYISRDKIQQLWNTIQQQDRVFTDQELQNLGVKRDSFEMDNEDNPNFNPHFFEPLTQATLNEYPIDHQQLQFDLAEDPYILRYDDFDAQAAQFPDRLDLNQRMALSPTECTRAIWNIIESHMSVVPRKNMPMYKSVLKDITGWTRATFSEAELNQDRKT
ncbi:hypothetical protein VTN77DRAFT_3071 [Rasamsonia byssochlamydoides]|uniref:uncharacterized protein n=1 Tax=Rasamsonia byssochlamydoides TaxID=89139 RepID=UPI00374300DA